MPLTRTPYAHGFFRVAACTPRVAPADPRGNLAATLELACAADRQPAGLAVFPGLGLSADATAALFFEAALVDEVKQVLNDLCRPSLELLPILLVAAPLRAQGALFN